MRPRVAVLVGVFSVVAPRVCQANDPSLWTIVVQGSGDTPPLSYTVAVDLDQESRAPIQIPASAKVWSCTANFEAAPKAVDGIRGNGVVLECSKPKGPVVRASGAPCISIQSDRAQVGVIAANLVMSAATVFPVLTLVYGQPKEGTPCAAVTLT